MRSCKPPSVGWIVFFLFWGGWVTILGKKMILTVFFVAKLMLYLLSLSKINPKYTNQSGHFSWKDRYVPNNHFSGSMSKKFTSVDKYVLAFMVCVLKSRVFRWVSMNTTRWWFYFFRLISTPTQGKWSNLTSIFFKGVETNHHLDKLDFGSTRFGTSRWFLIFSGYLFHTQMR